MSRLLVVLLAMGFVVSCDRTPAARTAEAGGEASATNQRVFQVAGVVKAVRPAEQQVDIKHEEIPNYMPAMTMPFRVKDTNDLKGLEPGQHVAFRLVVTETDGWIEDVRPKSAPPLTDSRAMVHTRLSKDVEPLQEGDPLPEYVLTNQLSQAMSTTQFKGQALGITFLFTRCPFPTFCPRMSSLFAEAQQKLLARPGGPTNWHLLTISFDPEFDRPEVLQAYARGYGHDPRHWTFATGALVDVTEIGEQLGLSFWREPDGALNHNLRTAVIDAQGRVQKLFQGNAWTSDELVAELERAAQSR